MKNKHNTLLVAALAMATLAGCSSKVIDQPYDLEEGTFSYKVNVLEDFNLFDGFFYDLSKYDSYYMCRYTEYMVKKNNSIFNRSAFERDFDIGQLTMAYSSGGSNSPSMDNTKIEIYREFETELKEYYISTSDMYSALEVGEEYEKYLDPGFLTDLKALNENTLKAEDVVEKYGNYFTSIIKEKVFFRYEITIEDINGRGNYTEKQQIIDYYYANRTLTSDQFYSFSKYYNIDVSITTVDIGTTTEDGVSEYLSSLKDETIDKYAKGNFVIDGFRIDEACPSSFSTAKRLLREYNSNLRDGAEE